MTIGFDDTRDPERYLWLKAALAVIREYIEQEGCTIEEAISYIKDLEKATDDEIGGDIINQAFKE